MDILDSHYIFIIMGSEEQGKRRAVLVTAICVLVIVLNHFWRQPLYERGIQMIQAWQSHSFLLMDWFFLAITMVIDPSVVFVGAILMMLTSRRKGKAFLMLMFILFNVFLAALLKAYDCDPRPFWTNDDIQVIGFYCPVEYGNPSGHSWFSAVIGFGILLEYSGPGKNFRNVWFSLLLTILVPLSRMYLGAHSLNQVLEGLTLGLACCLLYPFIVKRKMLDFLTEFNRNSRWKGLIVLCHILYLIPYFINADEQLPEQWQQNIYNKCLKGMDEVRLNFLMLTANALFVNVATGIAIGYSSLANHPLGIKYLEAKWEINQQRYSYRKGYFYYIVVEVGCLLSGLVCAGIAIFMHPTQIVAFVGVSLGGLASGYIYTAKTIRVHASLKLIRGRLEAETEIDQNEM